MNPDASTQGLRIIFAGTPEFAEIHLLALLQQARHRVIAVYTQPDRPAGRGKHLTPSPVKRLAEKHSLPVFQPGNFKSAEDQRQLGQLKPDLMLVVAYGLLLPPEVLAIPRLGCINVHASLLPRWRGAAPIQRAIEAGDTETGVTIMRIDSGLDSGDMLLKVSCPIMELETGGSLHDRLAGIGAPAMLRALDYLAAGTAKAEPQDDALSTYAPKISKQEAQLDWRLPARVLDRKVRAFNPFPVAFSDVNGERVRIWAAKVVDSPASPDSDCGVILEAGAEGILVACGENVLSLTEIQLPGKKRLPAAEVLKARKDLFAPGSRFSEVD